MSSDTSQSNGSIIKEYRYDIDMVKYLNNHISSFRITADGKFSISYTTKCPKCDQYYRDYSYTDTQHIQGYVNCKCGTSYIISGCKHAYYDEKKDMNVMCAALITINRNDKYNEDIMCELGHKFQSPKVCVMCKNIILNWNKEYCRDCNGIYERTCRIEKEFRDCKNMSFDQKEIVFCLNKLFKRCDELEKRVKYFEEMIEFAPGGEQMLQAQQRFETSASANDNKQ